jgi:hypothetical protein
LGPENCLHVLAKRRQGEPHEAIDAAADAFDIAALVELDQSNLLDAGCSRLGGGKIAELAFRDVIELVRPLT